jgi:mannose-6-phosphate isomerase
VNIEYQDGSETLGSSERYILPASIGEVRMVPEGGETILMACYFPDLRRDVITLLREAEYSDEEIRALGEVTGWST